MLIEIKKTETQRGVFGKDRLPSDIKKLEEANETFPKIAIHYLISAVFCVSGEVNPEFETRMQQLQTAHPKIAFLWGPVHR